MKRRSLIESMLSLGAISYFGISNILTDDKHKVVCCKIEDFWGIVTYEKEWKDGVLQRNVYRIEDYPTCSVFKRIRFEQIRKGDHFIIVPSKLDYMGPNTGYGFISRAYSDIFKNNDTFGIQLSYINMPQCWTEEAFDRHMILSGGDYSSPSGHYKNGVRIG